MSGTNPSNIPIPDPSVITAQEIAKAKLELREEFKSAMNAEHALMDALSIRRHDVLAARQTAKDEADKVLAENVNRFPTLLDREASRLEKLFEERLKSISAAFDGVQRQFDERDVRAQHDKQASETAISTAFQAAKEAVATQNDYTKSSMAKSEASFTKEIDNIKSRVDDLGRRQDKNDGLFQNVRQSSDDRRANTSTIIVAAIGIGTLLIMGLTWFTTRPAPAQYGYQAPPPPSAYIPGPVGSQTTPIPPR
jgi:hypothetical protein